MINRRLTQDLIPDTSLWRLEVRIAPDSLSALLIGPMSADRSVMAHSEPLPDPTLKSLENAIYDNPLLLGDFQSVSVIISTSQLVQIPQGISAPLRENIVEAMLPDSDTARRTIAAPMPDGELLAAVDAETLNFLLRTFPDARLTLSLSVDARWLTYYNRNRGDSARLYALCYADEMKILKFNDCGSLVFANRFDTFSAADCAYYILATAGSTPLPVSVGGSPDLRNAVIEQLRLAAPGGEFMPLTLPDSLLTVRRQAPEICDDLIFLTEL